jgi:hypothetical protein
MVSHSPMRTAARILIFAGMAVIPVAVTTAAPARAEVMISVGFAPPVLPVYAQPACPGDGFLWAPGYWAYGPDGYFWVPGTWVRPPQIGYLWTPGYWGWGGSSFIFHGGYWGPHIGFYGGINYGFGYGGVGYEGGYWRNGAFAYNRSVNNINVGNVHNVYERPVAVGNAAYNHVSYNGGNGGNPYRASPQELQATREQHFQPTGEQMQHQNVAGENRAQFASVNRGHPGVTAAATPAAFRSNPSNPAAARGGFGGSARFGEVNRGALNGQERQQASREQNGAGRQTYSENRNTAAAPRAESRPAPAARSGGGYRGAGGGGHQGGGGHGGRR